jgi:hypothetical protein
MIRTRPPISSFADVHNSYVEMIFFLVKSQKKQILKSIAQALSASRQNDLDVICAGVERVMWDLQFSDVQVKAFFTTPNHTEIQIEVKTDFSVNGVIDHHTEKIWFPV